MPDGMALFEDATQVILPAPHPICVVMETFQCSYLGMGHSLL